MIRGAQCSICRNPSRALIDAALARGFPMAALGRRFAVSEDALGRHAKSHLSAYLRKVKEGRYRLGGIDIEQVREVAGADILAELQAQRVRLRSDIDAVRAIGAPSNLLITLERELRASLNAEAAFIARTSVGSPDAPSLVPDENDTKRIEHVVVHVDRNKWDSPEEIAAAEHPDDPIRDARLTIDHE